MDKLTLFNLRSHHVDILSEDDDIIVLNKPSGLLVLPDRFDPDIPNLLSLFKPGGDRVYVVHRLDKDTSGCLVLARTAEAHAGLNADFETRSVEKLYVALCMGVFAEEEGIIDLPLGENQATHTMKIDRKGGKASQTAYAVRERFRGFTLVEAKPLTGRTHQIRVHLKALGHAIVADPLYGDGRPFFLSAAKKNYREGKETEKPLLARTALHAETLGVRHPRTHEQTMFTAPVPKDLRSAIRMLRKYAPPRPS